MPTVSFNATFVSRQEVELDLTDQEWADLQSGKKKYHDFLDSSDFDSGEWTEGFVYNLDTMETL
jgi:hypothetical protein